MKETATVVGLVGLGALIGVVGRGEAVALGVGVWLVALGVVLQVGRVLRDRERTGLGGPGRIATRSFEGGGATVLLEDRARHVAAPALSVLATAPFVALILAATSSGPRGGAAGVVTRVLLLGALLVPVGGVVGGQLRRALRAGIWLTPQELVVRECDVTSRVRWSDIRWIADADGPTSAIWVAVTRGDAVTVHARRRRDRAFRAAAGGLLVPTGRFALDAPELVGLLRACRDPSVAARLGSDAGLAAVRGARRRRA